MKKISLTISILAASAFAANASTYLLYDAAGGATNPTGGGWIETSTNAGIDLNGSASTTTDGNDAWHFGDASMGGGQGDSLVYNFSGAQVADMTANGFTLTVRIEALGDGGFTAFGYNTLFGGAGPDRSGFTPGSSGGVTETLSWTWAPAGTVSNSNGNSPTNTNAYWGGAAAGDSLLNLADNTVNNSGMNFKLVSATLVTVPEPSAAALFGLAGIALIFRRRR